MLYVQPLQYSYKSRAMASGSASSCGTLASSPAAVIITSLQEMQGRLRRVESKQTQLQAAIEEVRDLVKAN